MTASQPKPAANSPLTKPQRRYRDFAWAFVVYLILVALFGAWVRITHSGAGCGDHWPSCHGEIIPLAPSVETIIEFTHRLSTGVLGILSIGLLGWAAKLYGIRHRVSVAAIITIVFIIFESLIGAKLVLSELVADNDSVARAVVIALHLVNTLALTGSAGLCAWWASGGKTPSKGAKQSLKVMLGLSIVLIVITSMMGAVTALGDTLFPVDPTLGHGLFDRVRGDLSAANHFLVRLRIIHPVIAVGASVLLIALTTTIRTGEVSAVAKKAAGVVLALVVAQLLIGSTNIYLGAPGWMQIIHLALAQALWITLLITTCEALARED
ncbi:COX15/CtaA family protein [Bradymonas sediminis]|uniref:Heme A synthase n=1 Tax=Bradymonas sediminis TaxID=1548548 RepID=A0A2Z4FKE5_9DELT|nr:COX15/CtaA family protein [Bradymonas sediminis]AWV89447.1 heme A synthase [Bradymonas sediminis]TDP76827.1 cytochrome c oxidase assembly protein subunit 15 [Bradymonas sediminis]